MKKNLIFVRHLDGTDHSIVFSKGIWKVTKCTMVLARGQKTSNMNMTSGSSNMFVVTKIENNVKLWPRKLGHMSKNGMKALLS